jgi:hypothetical protein
MDSNIQFMTRILSMGAMWQKIKRFTKDEIEGITNNYGTLIGREDLEKFIKAFLMITMI